MPSAHIIRHSIESALADRIPSALTPQPKMTVPVVATGIEPLDDAVGGGLPVGALTEIVGAECTGRTSIAMSFVGRVTAAEKVCAWIDVSNSFDPLSAAATGVDLSRLLWVRCGATHEPQVTRSADFVLPKRYFAPPTPKRGLHGGGFGPDPRSEANGMADAVRELLQPLGPSTHSDGSRHGTQKSAAGVRAGRHNDLKTQVQRWTALAQGLRATDLILQSGGFAAIVVDIAGLRPEAVSAIELSTWHRYRVAAERTRSSVLLLTQYACSKSSSALQLQLNGAENICNEATVFTGLVSSVDVSRRRFGGPESNVIAIRKPPQREICVRWRSRTMWAGAQ